MDRVLRVLVIDDSAYVRKVVREILSRSPFLEVVGAARDGREALDLVEQLNPDVITCDLNMPELDGVEFCPRANAAAAGADHNHERCERDRGSCADGARRRR